MTEHKTMNTIIHAAFRRDLARFDSALAAFPGTQARADQLWTAGTTTPTSCTSTTTTRRRSSGRRCVSSVRTSRWSAISTASTSGWRRPSGREHRDDGAAREPDGRQRQRRPRVRGRVRRHPHRPPGPRGARPRAVRGGEARRVTPSSRPRRPPYARRTRAQSGTFFAWLSDDAGPDERAALGKMLPAPVMFVLSRVGGRDYRRRVASVWS